MDGKISSFRDICSLIQNNKNVLMLTTVFIYIMSLIATLTNNVFSFTLGFTLFFILCVIKKFFPIKYTIIWILIFYFGIFNTTLRLKDTDTLLNIAPINTTITGKILSIPQVKDNNKIRFFFDVKSLDLDGEKINLEKEKVLVTLETDKKLKRFDSYEISGRLSVPFKAGNPYQFDYGNYLRNFGTYAVFYGKDYKSYEEQHSIKEVVLQKINDYRDRIINIHSNYLVSPNLEILGGIVFGDDAVSTPDDIKQSFIKSGLLHILAASGMNVAFIYSFFFLILSLFKVNFKINTCIGIMMIIIYALMTGLGSSVIRATLMLIFVLIGKLIDRDAHSISLLSFVAFIMLIYNPMYINDVGFQLSFIVTFGLLIMSPYITNSKNKYKNWILGTILIPVIAQIWVMPIQIYYFNNISIYSVFANIMSMPILALISFGGFISSLLSIVTPIANFVCKIFDFFLNPLITMLVNISNFWGQLPNSTLTICFPHIIQILVYYSIILILTALLNKNIREKYQKYLKYMLIIFVCIFTLFMCNFPSKKLEITAFDVGNADAFLIKTPNDKYIMVDTAKSGYNGGKSQAEIIILNYLRNVGVKHIDTIIISHFDNDHCGGAVDIMNNIKVDNLYVNNINHNSIAAKEIFSTAKKHGVRVYEATNNQSIIDYNNLHITNFIAKTVVEKDDNEASILTLLEYNGFKILFCGDAGKSTLEKIKTYLPQNLTVLKIGHHGAKDTVSPHLLEYFKPKISLISVGQNKFGHPDIKTIEKLKNTLILRTDINNCIRFIIDKNEYKIFSYDIHTQKFKKITHSKLTQ